jgi:peptidoglycan/xylan/chitin deacetylase (PgdA/CDA1 family)
VCITFDDGYRSTHDLALPVLKELGLPATVFIATRYLDGTNMWNDRIIHAVRNMPQGLLELSDIGLGRHQVADQDSRERITDKLIRAAKYMPTNERQALTDRLDQLTDKASAPGPSSLQEPLMLTPDMVKTLVANGFEVGGHTVTHPILTRLEDSHAREEIVQCKQELESITGQPVRLFAYPNGKVGMDYDERHVLMAKQAGYDAAFITSIGPVSNSTDLFQIPRGLPWDKSPLLFQLRLLRWLAQSN